MLEGVHLVPGLRRAAAAGARRLVFVVLSIEDEEEHIRHFRFRDEGSRAAGGAATSSASPTSAGCRSSSSARAQRAGVPVIENEDADRAARTVAELVLDAAEQFRAVTQ